MSRCHVELRYGIVQPRSQGSLPPALLSLRRAGRREPWERGWGLFRVQILRPNFQCNPLTAPQKKRYRFQNSRGQPRNGQFLVSSLYGSFHCGWYFFFGLI